MKNKSPVQFRPVIDPRWSRSLLAIGLAANIAATQPPPRSEGERNVIIVQGERPPEEAVRQSAARFVQATGVAAGTVPAARWVDPVCPRVKGLEDIGKRAAEAKMRRIAALAGIAVAPESCRPNIVVSFTADGAGLARQIYRLDSRRLGGLSPQARDTVLASSTPVRWLYSTEVRGRYGQRLIQSGGAAQTAPATHAGSGAGSSLGGDTMMHYESSIVSTLTNRVLTSAIVIIDTDDVMGRRLDTLAAYAALVAFAEIRNLEAAPDASILGLFASSAPPSDLTPQDTAFLHALYRLKLDREAMQHRGKLVHEITRELAASEGK